MTPSAPLPSAVITSKLHGSRKKWPGSQSDCAKRCYFFLISSSPPTSGLVAPQLVNHNSDLAIVVQKHTHIKKSLLVFFFFNSQFKVTNPLSAHKSYFTPFPLIVQAVDNHPRPQRDFSKQAATSISLLLVPMPFETQTMAGSGRLGLLQLSFLNQTCWEDANSALKGSYSPRWLIIRGWCKPHYSNPNAETIVVTQWKKRCQTERLRERNKWKEEADMWTSEIVAGLSIYLYFF